MHTAKTGVSEPAAPAYRAWWPHDTILRRLIIFAVALVLPLLVLIGTSIRDAFDGDRADAMRLLQARRTTADRLMHNYLERVQLNLAEMDRLPALQDLHSPGARAACAQFLAVHPEFTNLTVVDRAGNLLFSTIFPVTNPPQNLAQVAPLHEILPARGFQVSNAARDPDTGRWGCVAAIPRSRQPDLLFVAGIDLHKLSEQLFLAPNAPLVVSVVDRNNTILLTSLDPRKWIGRKNPAAAQVTANLGASRPVGESTGIDGRLRTFDTGRLDPPGWLVFASLPTDEIFRDARRNLTRALGAIAIMLLLSAFFGAYYVHGVTRPIAALAAAARARTDSHAEALAPVNGPREIAETTRAFNEMVARHRVDEQMLVASERRYREIFQNNPHPMLVFDAESLAFLDVNDAMIRHYGYSREEFLRMTVLAIRPPDEIPRIIRFAGQLKQQPDGVEAGPAFGQHRKKNGEIILVRVAAHSIDYAGKRAVVAIITDVTESRRAEQALEQSEHRYRTVIEQTGQMVYDYDVPSGRVNWFGLAAIAQITGGTPEELNPRGVDGWKQLLHPDDREAAIARLARSLATGEPCQAEYRLLHKDGSYRLVEERGVVLRDAHGALTRMLGCMTDITARRQTEESRRQMEKKLLETQKLESLGVLAGGIAHDFNNLLTGILGNAGLARLDLPAGWRGAEYIEQIERTSLRAADLCKQMLAYSGKGRFVIQNLDLNALLEDTTQLLQVSISKKATLRFKLARALPAIQADATQLRQIVMNLVINASEALGDRTGTITLGTGRLQADAAYLAATQYASELTPGDYVFLEVGDDGAGMARETLARIFDPFFTTKFTGRGLGLAAVLGIVRGHKGAIKVYSELGRGTTFKLLFPASSGAAQEIVPRPRVATGWRGSGRVLIADDEEAVRTVAARVLQILGFTVDTAVDGQEAVKLFRLTPGAYAVVLLDLTMPRMDGEETFRQLRQLQPDVKVILMSGFNKADAINRFTGMGLAGFAQKPFEVDTLAVELRRVLEPGSTKPT